MKSTKQQLVVVRVGGVVVVVCGINHTRFYSWRKCAIQVYRALEAADFDGTTQTVFGIVLLSSLWGCVFISSCTHAVMIRMITIKLYSK